MNIPKGTRTWVDVDTKAAKRNLTTLFKAVGKDTLKMVVVKSNAYGHDMDYFAHLAVAAGADMLGVDSFEEAKELRVTGISLPILVLGYTSCDLWLEAADLNVSITISNMTDLERLCNFPRELKIHIKVDTGLHRQGFLMSEKEKAMNVIESLPLTIIEGVYSHLSAAETPALKDHTERQFKEFEEWKNALELIDKEPIAHISASAAALIHPHMRCGMVRFGITAYGLWPSVETRATLKKIKLEPILSWHARISEIKKVPLGEPVGYDCTETLLQDSTLAVISVGYWHGLPRSLSSVGEVLVKGKRARIVGRISMDMSVIDITGIVGIKAGDVVTFIGKNGKDTISVEEVALKAGTINYEIVTRINQDIPRIYC
jgi:alanine racemase